MFAENIAAQWSLNRDKSGNLLLLYDAASQRTGSYVSDALKPFLSDEPLTDWDSSVATNDGQGIDKNCVSAYRTITDSLCEQYYKAGSALREAVDSQALKHTRLPKNRKEGLLATICNGIAFLLFTAISTYAVAFLIPAAASLILFPFAVLLALLQIIRCVVVYPFSRSFKKDLPAVEGTATDRLSVRICTIVAMYHSLYTGIVSQMYPW